MGKFPILYCLTVPVRKHEYKKRVHSADKPSILPNFAEAQFEEMLFNDNYTSTSKVKMIRKSRKVSQLLVQEKVADQSESDESDEEVGPEEIWEDDDPEDSNEKMSPTLEKMIAHAVLGIYTHTTRAYARHLIREKLKFDMTVNTASAKNHTQETHVHIKNELSQTSQFSQLTSGAASITYSIQSEVPSENIIEDILSNTRLVPSLDGAHFELQAVDYFMRLPKYKNIEFLKWAASCSFFQQANDLMKSFVTVRKRSKKGPESVHQLEWRRKHTSGGSLQVCRPHQETPI